MPSQTDQTAPSGLTHTDALTAPNWMSTVLRAAGVYNVMWGIFAILFPMAIFRWAGFDPLPNYPELWQCIGMIVGVYGFGYWFAAADPYRHWPIVLVGFLGKIFGPIGFVGAVTSGRFPAKMGLTIVTNDLIWWVPFALILLGAARCVQTSKMLAQSADEPEDQHGRSFGDAVSNGKSYVVFLRHAGCSFCRESLAELSRQRQQLAEAGVTPILVHMGPESEATRQFFANYQLGELPRFSDPAGVLYQRFGLLVGHVRQMFGPRVWLRGFHATITKRHGIGKLVGNGFQLPGAAYFRDGELVAIDRAEDASHTPDVCRLIEPPATATVPA